MSRLSLEQLTRLAGALRSAPEIGGNPKPARKQLSSHKIFYGTAFLRIPASRLWKAACSDAFFKYWIR